MEYKKGGVYMATSSITKNFVISENQQVEMFADAVEASANNRPVRIPVKADFLTDPADIIKLMEKESMHANNKYSVVSMRSYLSGNSELGEDILTQILSEFSCIKNPDVDQFLKNRAVEFTKKNQSVTYLVFAVDDG